MTVFTMLFIEFFKIGMFAVGGGLATLPFLYDLADKYDWFTRVQLIDMIAISESTPGPIGINMATFAGYQAAGVLGAVVASLSMIIPSLIIIISIAKVLSKFRENKFVNGAFYGLRPAVAGLIGYAAWSIIGTSLLHAGASLDNLLMTVNWKAVLLFAILYYLLCKYKKHPIVYIGIAAAVGAIIPLHPFCLV